MLQMGKVIEKKVYWLITLLFIKGICSEQQVIFLCNPKTVKGK